MGTEGAHNSSQRSRTQSALMALLALVGASGSVAIYIMLHPGGRREIEAHITIEPIAAMLVGLCTTAALLLFIHRLGRRAAEIERLVARRADERDRFWSMSADLLCVSGFDGYFKQLNPAWIRLLGYSRQEMLSQPILNFIHPEDRSASLARKERFRREGEPIVGFENRFRCRDGSYRWLQWDSVPFKEEGVVYSVAHDVTERRQQEKELRKLSIIASRTDNAVILTDALGKLEWVNDGFTRITGYALGEVRGRTPGSFLSGPGTDRAMSDEMSAKVRAGEGFHVEILNYTKSGRAFWNSIDGQPLHDASGVLTGFMAIERDVTDQKNAEQALARQAAELEAVVAERTADLVSANRELQEAMAQRERAQEQAAALHGQLAHVARHSTMGEMASGLAHELNQPLWAIINYLQGALHMTEAAEFDVQKLRGAMTRAAAQAERAGQIIQRLREFVAKRPPEHAPAPLGPLVREVIDLLAAEIRQNRIGFRLQIGSPAADVFVDRIQIQQVLVNLMRNAIEAIAATDSEPRDLTLRISDSTDPQRVQITVTDTGPGCDEPTLLRLFEPFYTTKPAGMGMGLAICRSIVESHGGKLEAVRAAGRGMSFGFSLPICREPNDG